MAKTAREYNPLFYSGTVNLHYGDCRDILHTMASGSVHLVVTSPPYNAGQEYEENLSEKEYIAFLQDVFGGIKRVLCDGGRVCWVVAPTISAKGVEFPVPLAYLAIQAAVLVGLEFWEEIVWDQLHTEANTAWGSWRSASAPFIRHRTERVLLFAKGSRRRDGTGKASNIFPEKEFEKTTLDVWDIPPAKREKYGHPCPFPLELAERCVRAFSFIGDTVLDPFMGSGTTGVACQRLERMFIGVDKEFDYVKMAINRLRNLEYYFG